MNMISFIGEIIYPTKNICYFCRSNRTGSNNYICKDCIGFLDIVNKNVDLDSRWIDEAYYITIYNRFMRDKIKNYKYYEKSYLYKPLGNIIYNFIISKRIIENIEIDYITYIPSSSITFVNRGYNQSKLLAKYISEKLKIKLLKNNLIKIKHTKEQNKLERINRLKNLKNVFKVQKPEVIKNKNIILIDDVLTTGSTFIECGKELKNSGANYLIAIALTSGRKV